MRSICKGALSDFGQRGMSRWPISCPFVYVVLHTGSTKVQKARARPRRVSSALRNVRTSSSAGSFPALLCELSPREVDIRAAAAHAASASAQNATSRHEALARSPSEREGPLGCDGGGGGGAGGRRGCRRRRRGHDRRDALAPARHGQHLHAGRHHEGGVCRLGCARH